MLILENGWPDTIKKERLKAAQLALTSYHIRPPQIMATERFVSSAQTRKAIQRLRKERQKLNQPAPPLPPVQVEEAGSGRSQSGDLLNFSVEGSPEINLTAGGDAENCSNNENQSSLIEKNVSDSNVNESSLQIDSNFSHLNLSYYLFYVVA